MQRIQQGTQGTVTEPVSGLFDQCGKIQERLNEAHVITAKLIGATPEPEAQSKKDDDIYLDNLAHRLRDILRDAGKLVEQLEEIGRRF